MAKLRWGIIGCAGIANAVIPGIQGSETGVVTAVSSRNADKANETANKFGIAKAYGSYEALLLDPDIDAVYIPLPNHLHKEWTVKAAEAGKHVLCEKPIALTAEETVEMKEACDKAGVILAEAFMYRFHPRYDRIKAVIQSGEIGEVRALHSSFTFNNAASTTNVRYVKEWGGGSLYDIGCYPISLARYLLDAEPVAATVHALFSAEHGDVDMMASGLLEFPNHVGLLFDCGMWAAFRNPLEILGTLGRIEVPNAFIGANADFIVEVGGDRRVEPVEQINQYSLQADVFARNVWGEPQQFTPDDAIGNMKALDACLQSAREQVRVVIQ